MRGALIAVVVLALAACSNAPSKSAAEEAYARGLSALAKQEPRTARVEFLNAIKGDPANAAYRLAQARAYLALNDGNAAQSEIIQARRLGTAEAETHHLMAQAYSLQGRHEEALAEAKAAPARYSIRLAGLRGRSYAALGDHERAQAEFRRALAANSQDGILWADIARSRGSDGSEEAAIVAADRAISLAPRSVPALILRGQLADRHETDFDALYWFNRALEVDPQNLDARVERLEALRKIGDYRATLAETRTLLGLSKDNPTAYYYQARIAAEARNFALARKLYHLTNGQLDEQPRVMLLASAIDYHFGNTEHALQRLKRLVAMRPKYRKARRLLAACYWRVGDADATVRTLRPLTRRRKPDAFALTLMARARAAQGDAEAAARYLERAARAEMEEPADEQPAG